MADDKKKYGTVAGVVQFDVTEREVGEDQTPVRDVTIRALGTQDRWSITLFPNFSHAEVEKGDFVVADGSVRFPKRTGDDGVERKYRNMTASVFHVNGSKIQPKDRDTEERGSSSENDDGDEPF